VIDGASLLPDHLKSKLNLSRRRLCRGDEDRFAGRCSGRIKDISIIERRSEIRVIQNINLPKPDNSSCVDEDEPPSGALRAKTPRSPPQLEDDLQGELDFSRGGCSPGQESGYASWRARWIEDVRVVRCDGRREVRMIEHIEHFRAELNVESLGNFANVVVLEYREINARQTR
jgi:hypothetical protein